MDENIDNETLEMLQEVLQAAKESSRMAEQKREAKLWADIETPLNLSRALSRLIKDELVAIRQELEIKKTSTLNKKELAFFLQNSIPDNAPGVFQLFDSTRYNLVKRIVSNGGYSTKFKLEPHQVEYLRRQGIIFSGSNNSRKLLVMPQEIVAEFQRADGRELQNIVNRNTEWVRLAHGLLYYYGTLRFRQLEEMISKYASEKINMLFNFRIIESAASFYEEIKFTGAGFSNYRVFDPDRVQKEHEARPEVDYYPFTKEQLLKAGEPGFIDRRPTYQSFVDYLLDNYEISKKEADNISEECVYATQIGDMPTDIIEYLQSQLEFDSFEALQDILEQIANLINNTRQWFLKGHTPEELLPMEKDFLKPLPENKSEIIDFKSRKKVGRNDPCPCGSGKKFKHCCGRL